MGMGELGQATGLVLKAQLFFLIHTIREQLDRDLAPRTQLTSLVDAAESGKRVEGLTGADRAMLYVLSAWTGFRRGEIASLTLQSFSFASTPPVIRLKAVSSKRRKKDVLPLHPLVAERLQAWLKKNKLK